MVRTPLAGNHLERGAALLTYHGAEVPAHFGDAVEEHRTVRASAGLFDFSFRSKFTLTGEHRVRFMHRIVSNDIRGLKTGEGRYALLLSAQGRILADLRVYADEDRLWVDTDADLRDKAMELLRRYVIGDRVEIVPAEVFALSLQGPGSRKALQDLLAASVDALEHEMDHRTVDCGGRPVRVVRLSSTGEEGYEFWLDSAALGNLWRAANAARAAVLCGSLALESLRIEAGIPRYGPDFGEDTLPLEAGLWNALSFNKGCYIGQEIVERARSRGHVNWKLMGLGLEAGAKVPAPGEPLTVDGKAVGEVTSACWSPTLGRTLALAYVRREVAEPGTRLALGSGARGDVASLPFIGPGEFHAATAVK